MIKTKHLYIKTTIILLVSNKHKFAELELEEYLATLPEQKNLSGKYKLLPMDSDRIISAGTNSIILTIPEASMVGRILGYRKSVRTHPEHYGLWGFDITKNVESTTRILEEFGFTNVTKLHPYVRTSFNRGVEPNAVFISPDLRENGRNTVQEIAETEFEKLANGRELLAEYEESHRRISGAIKNGLYQADVFAHGYIGSDNKIRYDKAIRNMFFVVKNNYDNTGRLIIEDLDHIVLKKKQSKENLWDQQNPIFPRYASVIFSGH